MTQFHDLMTDVECMGNKKDGALISIGAVFFDLHTMTLGPTFLRTINLATAMRAGGTVEASTIMFWLGQSEEARKGVRFGGQDIRVVLTDFGTWIQETCRHEDVRPYGNSASFDLGKIESACERSGVPVPWHWTHERCFRTIRNQHPGVEYNPDDKGDGAHNALADAVFQAEHLFKIKRARMPK